MTAVALVCQRDADLRQQITVALASKGFRVAGFVDPMRALAHLQAAPPVVAVVDWQHGAARRLITELGRHVEVPTFVFDTELLPGAGILIVKAYGGVPRFYPESLGVAALGDVVVAATGKMVGDLRLRNGAVECGIGRPYKSKVAPKLVMAYPNSVHLPDHSDQVAVWRFNQWLAGTGSAWRVDCVRREALYRLVVVADRAA